MSNFRISCILCTHKYQVSLKGKLWSRCVQKNMTIGVTDSFSVNESAVIF